ncbi:E3 ubiquitin-protein ligase RING1-like protein [Cinnamomum micranthum f. kanehirae]|uniref:E3 ubiquitin-protein ligase RING1-like protein n=1 Tax=Cinnamomum micranthum f. kanehirae TaxID=337451 RepID=A0A443NFA5_9MAGN|nr:E3 ubiquitin-protein ligase RING1-like protein [Cinnamomum micranthum f. kanehirae]
MEDPDHVLSYVVLDTDVPSVQEAPDDDVKASNDFPTHVIEARDEVPLYVIDAPDDVPPYVIEAPDDLQSNLRNNDTVSLEFTNTHGRQLRSFERDVPTTSDELLVKVYWESNLLWSPTQRHSLIRRVLSCLDLISVSVLAELESETSLCLLNLVSNAEDEGYSAINVVLNIDVATVDTYDDEEEFARAISEHTGVAGPALRSSLKALQSQEFDDRNSFDKCNICLDDYSHGVKVTQLPCSHDFHRECIERWLNLTNSCPICRSPI